MRALGHLRCLGNIINGSLAIYGLGKHLWFGEDLLCLQRTAEGNAEIRKALDLDLLSTVLHTDLAWRLCMARRYDEPIAQASHVLELDPDSSLRTLGTRVRL
jgi:hypothetical protein